MKYISLPFTLLGRGGFSAVLGILLLAFCLLLVCAVLKMLFQVANFAGVNEMKVKATVTKKYVSPEHTKWLGKALVTIPEQEMIEILFDEISMQFAPASWKYERIGENDTIEVKIRRGRLNDQIVISDIGPF
jgi:hypothetical protein